jgi:hypothetical protein
MRPVSFWKSRAGGFSRSNSTAGTECFPRWPKRRDLDTFDRRFEWSFHSMVADLYDYPLLEEEI